MTTSNFHRYKKGFSTYENDFHVVKNGEGLLRAERAVEQDLEEMLGLSLGLDLARAHPLALLHDGGEVLLQSHFRGKN